MGGQYEMVGPRGGIEAGLKTKDPRIRGTDAPRRGEELLEEESSSRSGTIYTLQACRFSPGSLYRMDMQDAGSPDDCPCPCLPW